MKGINNMSAESFLFNFIIFMMVVFTMYLINKGINYLIRREEAMKEKNSKFTERLKGLREEKGVTQSEMAFVLGVSLHNYLTWESGINTPNTETLVKLADYFDVSTDFLLGRITQDNVEEFGVLFEKIHTEFSLLVSEQGFEIMKDKSNLALVNEITDSLLKLQKLCIRKFKL